MLSVAELMSCRLLLQNAHAAVIWTANVFYGDKNTGAAARLNDIANQLAAEIADIDRLLNQPKP